MTCIFIWAECRSLDLVWWSLWGPPGALGTKEIRRFKELLLDLGDKGVQVKRHFSPSKLTSNIISLETSSLHDW